MNTNETKNRLSLRRLIFISLFAAIIAVTAMVTIPMPGAPFTLQLLGVFLAVFLLGARDGGIAVLLYLALGAVGLPIFSSFKGGIGALIGPTGGYLFGFLLIPLSCGLFTRFAKGEFLKKHAAFLGGIVGNLLCYLCGTAWFVFRYLQNGKAMTFASALMLCVVPYIIPDLVKLIVAKKTADLLSRRGIHF